MKFFIPWRFPHILVWCFCSYYLELYHNNAGRGRAYFNLGLYKEQTPFVSAQTTQAVNHKDRIEIRSTIHNEVQVIVSGLSSPPGWIHTITILYINICNVTKHNTLTRWPTLLAMVTNSAVQSSAWTFFAMLFFSLTPPTLLQTIKLIG